MKNYLPTLDDMVFEHRNKFYGAFELRRSYSNSLRKATFFGTAFMLLITGSSFVYFKSQPKEVFKITCEFDLSDWDELPEEEMKVEGKPKLNFARTFAGGSSKHYLNHNKKDYFYQTSTFGEDMLVEMKPKEWKITQETKTIGGYVCYKAIDIASTSKKQKPIAWFTPQIPINAGPGKNFGLPGLILRFEEYRRSFTAIKIELNPKEKIKIKKPTKGKKMSHEEFTKFLDKISPFGKIKN